MSHRSARLALRWSTTQINGRPARFAPPEDHRRIVLRSRLRLVQVEASVEVCALNHEDSPEARWPVGGTLIARRLVLTTLLWKATNPKHRAWDVDRWEDLLPGCVEREDDAGVARKVNFTEFLWIHTGKDVVA